MKTFALLLVLAGAGTPATTPPTEKLDLAGLLELALAHDGRLLEAQARLAVYRARLRQAQWAWFPRLRLRALIGGPVGERRLDCADAPDPDACLRVTEASKGGDFDLGKLSIALGGKLEALMPIYTFGKLDGAKQAAAAGVTAGRAGLRRARQEVAFDVRRGYWGWLLLNNSVEVLEKSQSQIRQAEKKLVKMLDELNEEVTDRDLFKLRYYAARLDDMLAQARQGRDDVLAALRFLTGAAELGRKRPLAWREFPAARGEPEPLEKFLSRARRQRPELAMLAAAREASRAAVEIARARFYPDFFLAGYVQGSWSPVQDYIRNPLLQPGLTNYDAALAVGLQLELDIPQKLAELDQARAELERLEAQAAQAERAVALEVEKHWQAWRAQLDRYRVRRRALRSAKSWMRANLLSYGVGVFDTKDLLDSIAAFAQATIDLDRASHDLQIARERLRLAVGDDLGRVETPAAGE